MTPGACGWRWEGLGVGAGRRFDAGLRSGAGLRFGAGGGVRIGAGAAAGVATSTGMGVGVGVAICSIAGRICISARCITDGPGSVQLSGTAAARKHNPRLKSTLSVTPVSILATHYFFVQSRDLDLKRRQENLLLCVFSNQNAGREVNLRDRPVAQESSKDSVLTGRRAEFSELNRLPRCIEPFDRRFEPPLPEAVDRRKHILFAQ